MTLFDPDTYGPSAHQDEADAGEPGREAAPVDASAPLDASAPPDAPARREESAPAATSARREEPAPAAAPVRREEPAPAAAPTRAFTAAQAAAIDERSHSLLLSAAAGSGKTAVLVERFVRAVLDDGIDATRILAITFTDKAAGELRERIRRRLEAEGTPDADAAARATEGAFVSTIHGFCSRLLRAHALAAGLDPGFAVLDEPRAARLREEAFVVALRAFLEHGGSEALDLVAAYRADALAAAIPAVHDELRSRGQATPRLPRVAPRPAPDAERVALAAAHARLASELASARDSRLVDDARDALDRCARFLEDVEHGVVPWPGRLEALKIACGRAAALDTPACHAYVEAREAFERACADHHAARQIGLFDDLLVRYAEAYAALKAARGALDFDDLELRARDLLRDHPAIRAAWRERFELVMVDEFQDTNRRQLEVLQALKDDQLFSVGDEFQSIYGFRHADVAIFRDRRDALAHRGLALRLEESFRCDPQILAAVNAAFAPRFGEHFAPLRSPRDGTSVDEPAVELLVTAADGWDDEEAEAPIDLGTTLPPVAAWRKAEARLLAQRLRELVDAGEAAPGEIAILVRASGSMPVLERALADVGLPTLATAGRGFWTRQEVVDLMAYLTALANPLDEIALLTTLGSPLCGATPDALALLVGAARAAWAEVWPTLRRAARSESDAGPASARAPAARAPSASAPSAPASPAPTSSAPSEPADATAWLADLDADDRARLLAFARRFDAERAALTRRSLDELLERAIADAGYDLTVLGLAGGARRMANIDKLLRLARAFEAAEGRDLRAFVDHAAMLEQAQKREPEAAVEDPELDAVRLMTIHAAKGLEFGVVAVADLGRRPNQASPTLVVDGDRVGLRLSLLDGAKATPALEYAPLDAARREREAAEEQRILYVALTRAKRRLVLSGGVPSFANGAAPLTWLGPALVPDLAERFAAPSPEPVARIDRDGYAVRLTLNTPTTFGAALRPLPTGDPWASEQRDAGRPPAPGGAPAAERLVPAPADAPPAEPLVPPPGDTPPSPQRTAPPPPTGPLSYTALSAYHRCGYRFYVQRQVGLPDVAAPPGTLPSASPEHAGGLDARIRGVVAHALVEELDLARPQPPTGQRIRELAAREGAAASEADVADIQALIAAFAASEPARRLAAARRVRREHEFAFPLGDLLLIGVIDALAVEPDGGWLVVDLKTDRLDDPHADVEALVRRDYDVQRRLYALAALRGGAPRVEVVHLYVDGAGGVASATFTAADAPALTADLERLTAALVRGEHPVSDAPHAALCATCPARGGLCPHPEERTLRSAPDDVG